ncbi:MAG: hypothetical protein QOF51_2845 [Chloroflexota bacterium]|nr:hypothetical protein [Chloroflexota bacterium]
MSSNKLPGALRFAGVGLVVFALFALAIGIAGAQQATPTPSPANGQQGGPRGQFDTQFATALAANLNLPVATVQNALQTTRQQLQASRPQGQPGGPGQGGPGGPRGDRGPGGFGWPGGSLLQNTATILNMSVDDLRTQMQQGQTLAQIAQAHGVTADSLANQLTQRAVQDFQSNQQQLHDRIRQELDRQPPAPGSRPAPGAAPANGTPTTGGSR